MVAITRYFTALALVGQCAWARYSHAEGNMTQSFATNLLHESMDWMDMYYDAQRGYLFSLSAAALTHETRASVWYAAGLLARNEDDDVDQAIRIVRNVVGGQFKNESLQWWARPR
jgi:hypothetical protein